MGEPKESKVNTVIVPQTGRDPATLFSAADRVLRIVVRNVGGSTLALSHDSSNLQQTPVLAGCFHLQSGESEVFVLMPRQSMYAASVGAAGLVSIAVSEAIPTTWAES